MIDVRSKEREERSRFTEIRTQSISDQVTSQLRRAIVHGAFAPGERLNESKIAREMGISRGPLREAIAALREEGLLNSTHGRGSFVVELNPKFFRDLADLRILLEDHAVRLLTKNATPDDIEILTEISDKMSGAANRGAVERTIGYDLDFHRTICQLCGNPLLFEAWDRLSGPLRLAISLSLEQGYGHDAVGMAETHPPVIKAIEEGKTDVAAEYLHKHTREHAEIIQNMLKQRLRAEEPAESGD
jgi:DNA-binding GntR family transcriptional regulator